MFRAVVFTSGMKNSTLIEDKDRELRDELGYQTALLADNLIYNMSLNEPSNGGDIGGDGGDEEAGTTESSFNLSSVISIISNCIALLRRCRQTVKGSSPRYLYRKALSAQARG